MGRSKKNQFRHESLQDRDGIQAILESLTEGLARGKLRLGDDEGDILLQPKGLLELRLSAEQGQDSERVNLRISWRVQDKKATRGKSLSVSSK